MASQTRSQNGSRTFHADNLHSELAVNVPYREHGVLFPCARGKGDVFGEEMCDEEVRLGQNGQTYSAQIVPRCVGERIGSGLTVLKSPSRFRGPS